MAGPALTDQQVDEIRGLLDQCVVSIEVGGGTGTGFFVAPGQVMTCRHVIERAITHQASMTVTFGPASGSRAGEKLTATLRESLPGRGDKSGWPDVAILDVPDTADSGCVMLDAGRVAFGAPLLTAGFPASTYADYQPQRFNAGEYATNSVGDDLLRITGDIVTPGMSGSPVVNLSTGFVCGILSITKSGAAAVGGFAMPFSGFAEQWLSLNQLNSQPPAAAKPWLQVLDELQLKAAGRDYSTGALWGAGAFVPRLELELEQSAADLWDGWQINVRCNPAVEDVEQVRCTISDLGNGVMRVVDSWSRRQTYRLQDEVDVLGDLLHQGMLPKTALPTNAMSQIAEALSQRRLRFRVCVDKAPRLSRLPWELARGDGAEPFAATDDMIFSRYVDVPDRSPVLKDKLRVLALIECPDGVSKGLASYQDENGNSISPDADAFLDAIRADAATRRGQIHFDYALNGTETELKKLLQQRWDIVHYIGFARRGQPVPGEPELRVTLGGGGKWRLVSVAKLEELLDLAQSSVFIGQFHKLPVGHDVEFPTDLSSFTSLLTSPTSVHPHALVITQSPMDLVDLGLFNQTFYEAISTGSTVEAATQAGRWEVRNQSQSLSGRDVAAFGSFMVSTTRPGEVRLLYSTQQDRPPNKPGQTSQANQGSVTDELPGTKEAFGGPGGRTGDDSSQLRAQASRHRTGAGQ